MKPTTFPIGTPYNARGPMWSLGRHTGVDYLTPTGSRLVAPADGTVRSVGYNGSYGYNVIIETRNRDGQLRRVSVNHLRSGGMRSGGIVVKTGQKVRAGQLVGYSGATGNTSGPHCHEEDRRSPFTFGNDVNPSEFNTWDNKPLLVIPRPAIAPRRWWGLDLRNLAGFNDHGAATWDTRIRKTITDIKYVGREVVVILELPNGKVSDFVRRMDAIGYNHAGGYNARHIFQERGIGVLKAKAFNLSPDLHGDNKAAYAAKLKVTPQHDPVIVATTQLENEDASGTTQVAQAKTFIKLVLIWAATQGVPKDRVFFALDGNSDSRVYREAFAEANYVDTAEAAWKSENSAWRTFVGWFRKPTKGKRIDLILCYRTRPVRRFRVRLTTADLSDHLDLFADFGKR